MKTLAYALPLVIAATTVACSGQLPPPSIVKQATPSPLVGAKTFVVLPLTFNNFTWEGKTEAEWLATRTQEQRDSWQTDKTKMGENIVKNLNANGGDGEHYTLGGQPQNGQFVIAVNVDAYDGEFRWTSEIRDASGQVVDVIRDPHTTSNHYNTWAGEIIFGGMAGGTIAQYVHRRSAPPPP